MTLDRELVAQGRHSARLRRVEIEGPASGVAEGCERVLRSLPEWFGIESSLVQYVRDTGEYPTFVARSDDDIVGFLTLREHFPEAWEVHCLAVRASDRGRGAGRALHHHVERWLSSRGARFIQVKTLAESHPSAAYRETRAFYLSVGYAPLEVFPELWHPQHPVLLLIKAL